MKEKVLGAEDACSFCHCIVKCGSKEYQGQTTLQWQNPDGKAHYKPNKGGCNVYGVVNTFPGTGVAPAPSSKTTEYAAALNVESKIPPAPMNKTIDEAFHIVLTALSVADTQMPTLYPGLDKKSGVYGQIRSKLAEDTLRVYCALITQPIPKQ